MEIDNKFNIEETVYLITDPEQMLHIVTGIIIRPYGLMYEVSYSGGSMDYYGFELSKERDMMKALDITTKKENDN